MKKLLLLPLLLMSGLAMAQQTLGMITYERKVFIDKRQFEGSNLPEGLADIIPAEQKSLKTLYFTPDATLYENSTVKIGEVQEYTEGNMMFRAVGAEPDEKVYTDIKNQKKTEQKDLMGKQFIVQSESLPASKWKTTGRQKKILGMPCMEAAMMDEHGQYQIKAWYTTAIPVSSGPDGMSGLPGMIMELSIGETMLIAAVKIEPMDAKMLTHIKPPIKGKKVTAKEYDAIMQKKLAEMEQQFKGEGNVIFKVGG
ncbi:GLPGLI family protein [compost metagenome]